MSRTPTTFPLPNLRHGAVAAALLVSVAWAEPAVPTIAHCAECVAALKARGEPLAQRVKRGDATAEAPLLPIVKASFAFIGTVYKQGVRSPQAEELLRNAEKAQVDLPPDELLKLQDACQLEGEQLLKDANYFERTFVNQMVRSRMDRLRRKR
ncbi:hypothetical protein [Piscinibacter sp. XHJ-5]|uniref:hypothetical protein n=1 Tax=Piscinibacter sp. XHJ-5 TaxID=3037797 RepID=UPI00245334FE|nr:hypothetical protein [Piscinibacter sp. XHJ-5]